MRRKDGKLSRTLVLNLGAGILAGVNELVTALDALPAEMSVSVNSGVRLGLLAVVIVGNAVLRSLTTQPLKPKKG